jgi:hypothetical protein
MEDLTLLIPVLLAVRIVLDLVAVASGGTSYRLEFAYFVLFLTGAVAILSHDAKDLWGLLAVAISLFSLVLFFYKRARHRRNHPGAAT